MPDTVTCLTDERIAVLTDATLHDPDVVAMALEIQRMRAEIADWQKDKRRMSRRMAEMAKALENCF